MTTAGHKNSYKLLVLLLQTYIQTKIQCGKSSESDHLFVQHFIFPLITQL